MKQHGRRLALLVVLAGAMFGGSLADNVLAAPPELTGEAAAPVLPPVADEATKAAGGKLVEPLSRLNAAAAEGRQADGDEDVTVLVDAAGDAQSTAADLAAMGVTVVRIAEDTNIVQAQIAARELDEAAALSSVARIRPRDVPILNVTTEGDAILDADDLRSAYAVGGAGVRVGVISDGLEGLAAAQAGGELPAVNSATCDAIGSAPAGQPANPTDAGAGAEGTAMLEIVHDIAPDAQLWFGYFGFNVSTSTSLDYMQAVDCLALNVDVVIDNVTYLDNGPYDGTSTVSQNLVTELNKPANRIRGYYNAVGSVAQMHYQETFVNSGFTITAGPNVWTIHRFQATASTTDGGQGAQCSTNPAFGYCGDRVFLPPGESLRAGLQWNEAWGAAANDHDLFLLNENTSQLILVSGDEQNGNDNPLEQFTWTNSTAAAQPLSIFIGRLNGAANVLDMFVICEECTPIVGNLHNFNTVSSSILNNADAGGGVMSLGAINADDAGHNDIAVHSGRGPTNDGRIKPDAVAIDKVSVSGAGGFSSPFVGTSAAAPHAGAIAALVLSCQPQLQQGEPGDAPAADRTALRSALLGSAVDLGAPGDDNTFGAGRLDADAAAAAAGCAPDADGDGVPQTTDNCPGVSNPTQDNSDQNFIDNPPPLTQDDTSRAMSDGDGDACDSDDDNDGLLDTTEGTFPAMPGCPSATAVLDPLNPDTDNDAYLDSAECAIGTNPNSSATKPSQAQCAALAGVAAPTDTDGDKILDRIEVCGYNTSRTTLDSDGDVSRDGCEVGSLNTVPAVNSGDQLILAQAITADLSGPFIYNADLTKDGANNSADQLLMAQLILGAGC